MSTYPEKMYIFVAFKVIIVAAGVGKSANEYTYTKLVVGE